MRSMRMAGVVLLVLLLAAGAALYYSKSRVSSLVEAALGIEAAAEEILTRAVGTEVTIESIDVALADGELSIRGLTVANPEGFHTPHALEADEVRVAMELASLLEDTVIIREIAVEKPLITYEIAPEGSNFEAIQHNAESFAGSGERTPGAAPARRILIENLYVRGGRVAASAVFLEGKSWKVPLPDIHLRNLSSGEDGVAAAGIVKEVTGEIARNARRSVAPIRELAGAFGDRIARGASEAVEDIKRELEKGSGNARESLEQGSEPAREALEKGAESAREALGERAESAREALEKGTEKVKKRLEKLLGKRTE